MNKDNRAVHVSHSVAVEAEKKVKRGGKLYIKVRNAHLKDTTLPTADTVAVLQPLDEVIWLGASEQNPVWHKIRYTVQRMIRLNGMKQNPPIGTVVEGYVFGSNLSINKPDMEVRSKNPMAPISTEVFVSSGCGIKA